MILTLFLAEKRTVCNRIFYFIMFGLSTVISNPAFAGIVINEIHYNPLDNTRAEEFIELHNTESVPVDLGGWSLRDAVSYTLPAGTTIPASGYLVIAEDPSVLLTYYGISSLGPWAGNLSSDGEDIELYDNADTRMDRVEYGVGFPWPTGADGSGASAELIHPQLDNNIGGSWRASGSTVGSNEVVYIAAESDWKYKKGSAEASAPVDAWRATAFDDAAWSADTAPFGYHTKYTLNTTLSDMQDNYSTVYYRHSFTVPVDNIPRQLKLSLKYDDGVVVWINGVEVVRRQVADGQLPYNETALYDHPVSDWEEIVLSDADALLYGGDNVIAVQSLNLTQGSSDYYFDLELSADFSSLAEPSPGQQNSVHRSMASIPPQIRQVEHTPKQPVPSEPVAITAKITDPDGMGPVLLSYQTVDPGNYIRRIDPAYETSWAQVLMVDDGTGGDALAGDAVYTVVLPAGLQTNRRLVRYRIAFEDALGNAETVPYADDEQPNFAYYVYAGIPDWAGAFNPGTTSVETFSSNLLSRLPVYTLITRDQDAVNCQYSGSYDAVRMYGTFVCDGEVHDHIQYRNRGEASTYVSGKNKWRFYFNRSRDATVRDNYGKKYKNSWSQLNGEGCSSPWAPVHRGMAGVEQALSFKAYDLAGIPSVNTHYYHFRVVRTVVETPATGSLVSGDLLLGGTADGQYAGDFWGLYLALEPLKSSFLNERNLPKGNLYKIEGNVGDKKVQGPTQPLDSSDWNSFINAVRNTTPSQAWWEANMDLSGYYTFRAINRLIGNVDVRYGYNHCFYHRPTDGRWVVIPWDLDMMFIAETHQAGVIDVNKLLNIETLNLAYRNRAREILDLVATDGDADGGQIGQLIREFADIVHPIGAIESWANADAAKWNMHPRSKGSVGSHSGQGNHKGNFFYSPYTDTRRGGDWVRWLRYQGYTGTATHEDSMDYLRDYATDAWPGGNWSPGNGNQLGYGYRYLAYEAADSSIPNTPTIQYSGEPGYPLNGLSFQCSSFSDPQGSGTFAAMQWRAAEVHDASAPSYDPAEAPPYELEAKWESDLITGFSSTVSIPVDALKVGHAYRVRVRMKDSTGRWSHWSDPAQFITGEASAATAMVSHLRVSELIYDPPDGSEYEFIELHNIATNLTLDLSGAAFTQGVDFTFPAGTTLEPDAYLLIIGTTNHADFRTHYGLSTNVAIAGTFSGSLSNGGEEIKLKTAPGGMELASFDYNNNRYWPLAAAGAGHSLIPAVSTGHATGALDDPGNWRASTYIGGSPGVADPAHPASIVLNEITAHTDYSNPAKLEYDSNDWIELYNPTAAPVNLSGWYLSDDPAEPAKWACPSITISAGGYQVFTEVEDFHDPITSGFGLDKAGEQVLLSHLPGSDVDRVVDAVGFEGQENGRSFSRQGDYWYATTPSQGVANGPALVGLRLSEVMYQPLTAGTNDDVRDEYIEIYNPTTSDMILQSDGEAWRINGGVDYTFPENTLVPAGSSLLLVGFDPTETITSNAFATAYGIAGLVRMFGPWSGKLGNRSEPVSLERPQAPDIVGDGYSWVIEDETVYGNQSPWPVAAGNGLALERLRFNVSGLASYNWTASVPTPGHAGASPHADQDGDGMSDFEESISGTNPNDPSSRFMIESFAATGFSWVSVSGRTYSVYWTADLAIPFTPIVTNLVFPQSSYTDSIHTSNPAGFYMLKVED